MSNQFGPLQTLIVGDPILLAVPTQKNMEPAPHDLDHFLLYQAQGLPFQPPPIVDLQDQFQEKQGVPVLQPRLFGNPVRKEHPVGVITRSDVLSSLVTERGGR